MIRDADDLKDRIGRAAYVVERARGISRTEAVRGRDRGRRRRVVRRAGDLHPGRQRRRAVRRRRGLPRRRARRRPARARHRHGRRRSCSGRARSRARPSATRAGRRSCARRSARQSRSSSTARCSTSSTAATAAKVKSFKVRVEPGALRSACPAQPRSGEETLMASRTTGRRDGAPRVKRARRRRRRAHARSSNGSRAPDSSPAASSTGSSASWPSSWRSATAARRPTSRARCKTIAEQPFGKVAARPRRDRPRRLRALAPRPRARSATGPRASDDAQGPHRRARQRHRLRRAVRHGGQDPRRLGRRRLGQAGQGDRRRARLARRPVARRRSPGSSSSASAVDQGYKGSSRSSSRTRRPSR